MDIFKKIRLYNATHSHIPGRLYYMGAELKVMVPYIDSGKLHEVSTYCWYEYNFGHTGNNVNARLLYSVMYDYNATAEGKEWFNEKCSDLFKLGFVWSEAAGVFSLHGVWSCYWEQVNRADKKWWLEYLVAIVKSINENKAKPSTSKQ